MMAARQAAGATEMLERLSLPQDDRQQQQQQPGGGSAAAGTCEAAAAGTAAAAITHPRADPQQHPVRLLVFFLNRLLNFRHAELEALVTLDDAPPHGGGPSAGCSAARLPAPPPLVPPPSSSALEEEALPPPPPPATIQPQQSEPHHAPTPTTTFDMRWELPHGGDRLSPFWHATFPSERAAKRAAERAALTRAVFEPWAEAGTMEELEARLRALPESRRLPWSSRGPGTRSFKLVVEAWGARMPEAARRAATQRALAAAGLRSRVDLSRPDDVFWLIVAPGNVEQGWTVEVAAAKAAEAAEAEAAEAVAAAAAAAAADAPGGGKDGGGGGGKGGAASNSAFCAKASERWFLDNFCRGSNGDGDGQGDDDASNGGQAPRPSPPHPSRSTLPYRAPTRLYFCRLVASCDRTAAVTRYNLNERPYIGPTSMDPEMAAVMANAARAQKGQLALDPFCGTGSILVALAAAGARVVGADIDVKVLRDGHAADGNAAAALARRRPKNAPKRRTAKRLAAEEAARREAEAAAAEAEAAAEAPASSSGPAAAAADATTAAAISGGKQPVASDVLSNFEFYGLGPRLVDLVRLDAHRPLLRFAPSAPVLFDAIAADPPYGVRAGGRKSARVEGSEVRDRATHIGRTFAYSLTECLEDLLDLSARLLRPGGRLVYFMPAVVPGGAAAEAAKAAVRAARAKEGEAGGGESSGRGGGGGQPEAAAAAASGGAAPPPSSSSSSGSSDEDDDDEDDDEDELLGREPPTHPCLAHVATCEQVLSSRYARRLVVMERTPRAYCDGEAAEHRARCRGALSALSDGLLAAVRLPRAPRVTRRERRARKEATSHRGKHV